MNPTEEHSSQNTVVVAFKKPRLRNLMMRSMRRHNRVIDAYSEPFLPSQNLMDVPCFIRFMDYQTYQANAESIVEQYRDCDIKSTPPLIVYGLAMELYDHPLIIDPIKVGSDYCLKLYRKVRRRAKRKQETVCF